MKVTSKELSTLEYLRDIIEAYEEVASLRMRHVKNSVLQNREFLDGLRKVFYQVKYAYQKELKDLQKKKRKKGDFKYIRSTNGKTVSVLLTANTGLYGDIISSTFDIFVEHIKNTDTDIFVVGKIGRVLFDQLNLQNRVIKFFDLADSGSDKDRLDKLLYELINYDKIVVFHGRFKNILSQEPAAVSISGDIFDEEPKKYISDARFIFEPSLEKVMAHFEQEILASIFEQSVHESNLSKYASRMIHLDEASERISGELKKTSMHYRRIKHRRQNAKQLATLTGVLKFL